MVSPSDERLMMLLWKHFFLCHCLLPHTNTPFPTHTQHRESEDKTNARSVQICRLSLAYTENVQREGSHNTIAYR